MGGKENPMSKILVTGGGGFLGQAICAQLKAKSYDVVSMSRRTYPELVKLGVTQAIGDVGNLADVLAASQGCQAIVHTAAKAGAWGDFEDFYSSNVTGTENVIAACRRNGIAKLVHTSSPSVVHTGVDLEGVDERAPYAEHFLAHYPHTKKLAEQAVLAANDESLATVALRPHLIWGPGDNHLLPRLAARAKARRLYFIGYARKKIDTVYIDNAAAAHVSALERLAPNALCAGKAYFITQDEPRYLDDMVNALLHACGLPPSRRRIPKALAYALGLGLEKIHAAFRIAREPLLTRFIVEQFSTAHWFDISAAKRDIGYAPLVSTKEGLARLTEWARKP